MSQMIHCAIILSKPVEFSIHTFWMVPWVFFRDLTLLFPNNITFLKRKGVDSCALMFKEWHETHLCQMEFPSVINWTSPFPFEMLLGSSYHFYSNFDRTFCKQTVETLIRRHILQRLVWVTTV